MRTRRLLAGWLFLLAGMIFVMVGLGGATRLTGSGLSIMRWAPVAGVLPPLSHADWERLYALYRGIPQYALEHQGFGLAGFEGIFWLEWVHRLWGRLIGLAVIVPLAIFWWQGRISRWLGARLLLFFVLGGVQGLIGWLMVSSGFRPDSTAVAAPWLVFHLLFALALYAAILWTALVLIAPEPARLTGARPLFRLTLALFILVALTIAAGGLTAGTHAGFIYNTFPLMEGHLVPANYARLHPFLANLTRNTAAVQFDHRLLATLTVIVALSAVLVALARDRRRWSNRRRESLAQTSSETRVGLHSQPDTGLAQHRRLPPEVRLAFVALGLVVLLQYALGVATLLLVVPLPLGIAHQLNATLLLTASLVALSTVRGRTA